GSGSWANTSARFYRRSKAGRLISSPSIWSRLPSSWKGITLARRRNERYLRFHTGAFTSAPHLVMRRRLRHLSFGQYRNSRPRGARPPERDHGDGGGANFLSIGSSLVQCSQFSLTAGHDSAAC